MNCDSTRKSLGKIVFILPMLLLLCNCTSGKLYYIPADTGVSANAEADANQTRNKQAKLACDVEFVGLPKVDRYAVEYSLSVCAKSVVAKGHQLKPEDRYLLDLDTGIVPAACGTKWQHSSAKQAYRSGKLSDKEYGYIVAHIDLGLATVNPC